MSKVKTHIGTITKLDLLNAPMGHQSHQSGCGIHRDKKKNPKGGRSASSRRSINEW